MPAQNPLSDKNDFCVGFQRQTHPVRHLQERKEPLPLKIDVFQGLAYFLPRTTIGQPVGCEISPTAIHRSVNTTPQTDQHRPTLLQLLVSAWRDPSVTPELAALYRTRQFLAVVHQLPLASFATLLVVAGGVFISWNLVDRLLLLLWSSVLVSVATINLVLWWHFVVRRSTTRISPSMATALALDLGLCGLLYAILVVYLFGVIDDSGRVLLVAVGAAFIATGSWMFASLPLGGVLWVLFLCGGVSIGVAWHHWENYALLAGMASFYCAFLCATVLISSRRFLAGLMAETEIDHQRQLVGLLLHDFEENASDWLWETDAQGALRHVSVRLTEATGKKPEDLLGRSFVAVINDLLATTHAAHEATYKNLVLRLEQHIAFADIVLPVQLHGNLHWWSFTAKPLHDEQTFFSGWRGVCSDITIAHERELEMTRLANVDALTGLASRHCFSLQLAAYFPQGEAARPCTLLMLDLDNFKNVNDSLGHLAGDRLLCEVARRLMQIVPPGGLMARLGGDEFALILPTCLERAATEALGRQLREALADPWIFNDHQIDIRASVGVSTSRENACNAEDLMKAADMALYAAKAAGRDTLRFFSEEMQSRALRKQSLLSDIRPSLQNGDFFLHYQPQIDFSTGAISGFEALVRWRHPVLGIVPPLDFIPLAEASGMIVPLGAWILQQACSDAMQWPSHMRVAVNISAVQIERSDLAASLNETLRTTGLAAQRLELELTESTLLRDSDAALVLLHTLRQIGVRVALDDFGTGFSSLSYLRLFPLDKLKIDWSFVHLLDEVGSDGKASAIVKTITQLAETLQLETTAEGVETPEQRNTLRAIGCTYGQGYLYSKPIDAAETLAFIDNWVDASAVNSSPAVMGTSHPGN